jgi:hypothetical protein
MAAALPLLIALPSMCKFIDSALVGPGAVLVHSSTESKACVAACAYREFCDITALPMLTFTKSCILGTLMLLRHTLRFKTV